MVILTDNNAFFKYPQQLSHHAQDFCFLFFWNIWFGKCFTLIPYPHKISTPDWHLHFTLGLCMWDVARVTAVVLCWHVMYPYTSTHCLKYVTLLTHSIDWLDWLCVYVKGVVIVWWEMWYQMMTVVPPQHT